MSAPPVLSAELLGRFRRQTLPAGYLVSTPRAADDRVLYLEAGRLRVYVASEERELTLAYLGAGELFTTHTPAYLCCEDPSTLLSMSTAEFAGQLALEPALLRHVMPVLGRILDNSIAIIEDLAFRDVAGRLARFLLMGARQQGVRAVPGACLALELSAGEIALLLGCTRQSVSSLLQRMVREGILARPARAQVVLLRPDVLRAWQDREAGTAV